MDTAGDNLSGSDGETAIESTGCTAGENLGSTDTGTTETISMHQL